VRYEVLNFITLGTRKKAPAASRLAPYSFVGGKGGWHRAPCSSLTLPPSAQRVSFAAMSTITTILEPDADGTLHLPLPEELRHGKIRITATLQRATEDSRRAKAGVWSGRQGFWMAPDFDEPLEDFREYME